jgi:hypothetical protein
MGICNLVTNVIGILSKEKTESITGQVDISTNISATLSQGKISEMVSLIMVNSQIIAHIIKSKQVIAEIDINTDIDIRLRNMIFVIGDIELETLVDTIVSKQHAYTQAAIDIINNTTILDIIDNETELDIIDNETELDIIR